MGGLGKIIEMLPGLGGQKVSDEDVEKGEKEFKQMEAIIQSMTPKERHKPDIINGSRRRRIAAGAGTTVMEVNRLLKQFDQSKQMMKQMTGRMGKKGKMPFNLPF